MTRLTLRHAIIPLLLLSGASVLSGCDDDESIVSALLDRETTDGDDPDDNNFDTDGSLRPDRLPTLDSQYEGQTGAATIDANEDDAQRMADTAFVVWHMVRIQQGIDTLIEIRTEEDNTTLTGDWAWERGFNGANCGDTSDIRFDGGGRSGEGSLDDACIDNINRTDGNRFRVDGEFEWDDARSDEGATEEDSTREVRFDSVTVTWRDEEYQLHGATSVETGSTTIALALDVEDQQREQTYRYLAQLRSTAGSRNDEFLFHPDLGGVRQIRASRPAWLQGSTACTAPEQAGSGRLRITEPDHETDFRVELAACDQYNILDGVDANGNILSSSSATLLEAL